MKRRMVSRSLALLALCGLLGLASGGAGGKHLGL